MALHESPYALNAIADHGAAVWSVSKKSSLPPASVSTFRFLKRVLASPDVNAVPALGPPLPFAAGRRTFGHQRYILVSSHFRTHRVPPSVTPSIVRSASFFTTYTLLIMPAFQTVVLLLGVTGASILQANAHQPFMPVALRPIQLLQTLRSAPLKQIFLAAQTSPTPGGLILQTQFWDTYTGLESQGKLLPKGNWTIHGLWPDNCDGSWESYCDFERQYDEDPSPKQVRGKTVPPYSGPGVDTFITDFGRNDLLRFMKKFWVSKGSSDASFWAHEFSKHGTCFSTFDTKCYDNYKPHEDVINFFDTVSQAYLKYPTYKWLEAANIVPSNSTTYTLKDMESALESASGALPYLGCRGNVLSEVWYYSHAKGMVQDLQLTPVKSTTKSKCPATGIRYPQRSSGSEQA
ncbi:Ribonuclease T2-like 1-A Short=RNase T2-like A; Flags: Precursor [Serendipita indica DSM 11827]|nr:Ribonuclease T2-like 1-A Short=RNase T2-like A; Flags: Precursor [Serendipita indica DSM 11827]